MSALVTMCAGDFCYGGWCLSDSPVCPAPGGGGSCPVAGLGSRNARKALGERSIWRVSL